MYMKLRVWLFAALTAGLAFTMTSKASAATRTVCFDLRLSDDRTYCPMKGDIYNYDAKRTCDPGGFVGIRGWLFELWDKDTDSGDDYCGEYFLGGTGLQCLTVEWENSACAADGEANPDFFIRLKPQVAGSHDSAILTALKGDGSRHSGTSWRNGPSGNPDKWVAVNCQHGSNCYILPGGILVPVTDPTGDRYQAYLAIDSAQRTLETFQSAMELRTEGINAYVDHVENLPVPGGNPDNNCPGGCSWDRWNIAIPYGAPAIDGQVSTHELGHVLQRREFGRDELNDNCSLNGNGWTPIVSEFESCATQEGWASYVAVVSWWNPDYSYPPGAPSNARYHGNFVENAIPYSSNCETNGHLALQVIKFFWDLDDVNNEGAVAPATTADTWTNSTTGLLNVWHLFPDGTDNRENYEGDGLDVDGVNLRDYSYHTSGLYPQEQHNCVHLQTYW
ncbi:MAG: hypothetical protein PHU25_05635 [Deltaproteobacteria bacterium]|nr:hypothetical protein [Deltaproteobacteria bacterium]